MSRLLNTSARMYARLWAQAWKLARVRQVPANAAYPVGDWTVRNVKP